MAHRSREAMFIVRQSLFSNKRRRTVSPDTTSSVVIEDITDEPTEPSTTRSTTEPSSRSLHAMQHNPSIEQETRIERREVSFASVSDNDNDVIAPVTTTRITGRRHGPPVTRQSVPAVDRIERPVSSIENGVLYATRGSQSSSRRTEPVKPSGRFTASRFKYAPLLSTDMDPGSGDDSDGSDLDNEDQSETDTAAGDETQQTDRNTHPSTIDISKVVTRENVLKFFGDPSNVFAPRDVLVLNDVLDATIRKCVELRDKAQEYTRLCQWDSIMPFGTNTSNATRFRQKVNMFEAETRIYLADTQKALLAVHIIRIHSLGITTLTEKKNCLINYLTLARLHLTVAENVIEHERAVKVSQLSSFGETEMREWKSYLTPTFHRWQKAMQRSHLLLESSEQKNKALPEFNSPPAPQPTTTQLVKRANATRPDHGIHGEKRGNVHDTLDGKSNPAENTIFQYQTEQPVFSEEFSSVDFLAIAESKASRSVQVLLKITDALISELVESTSGARMSEIELTPGTLNEWRTWVQNIQLFFGYLIVTLQYDNATIIDTASRVIFWVESQLHYIGYVTIRACNVEDREREGLLKITRERVKRPNNTRTVSDFYPFIHMCHLGVLFHEAYIHHYPNQSLAVSALDVGMKVFSLDYISSVMLQDITKQAIPEEGIHNIFAGILNSTDCTKSGQSLLQTYIFHTLFECEREIKFINKYIITPYDWAQKCNTLLESTCTEFDLCGRMRRPKIVCLFGRWCVWAYLRHDDPPTLYDCGFLSDAVIQWVKVVKRYFDNRLEDDLLLPALFDCITQDRE